MLAYNAFLNLNIKNKFKKLSLDDLANKCLYGYNFILPKEHFICIHVRRGDYLNNPSIHPTCTKEYYQKALESFSFMKYTPIFVSDDIKWCKENFKGEFSPFKDELEDLTLLSMCNDNIIANSTFSWWGAYLNQSKIKVVVSPKQWFGENGPQDTQDIIPNNWIKI